MLSVTDFDLKGTTSEVRVHVGDRFGHAACWSIAKCSFSSKFSKSFDHHGKRKKAIVKKIVSKVKQPEHPWGSVRNIVEYVMANACEDGCVKVANVKSAMSRPLNVR